MVILRIDLSKQNPEAFQRFINIIAETDVPNWRYWSINTCLKNNYDYFLYKDAELQSGMGAYPKRLKDSFVSDYRENGGSMKEANYFDTCEIVDIPQETIDLWLMEMTLGTMDPLVLQKHVVNYPNITSAFTYEDEDDVEDEN